MPMGKEARFVDSDFCQRGLPYNLLVRKTEPPLAYYKLFVGLKV